MSEIGPDAALARVDGQFITVADAAGAVAAVRRRAGGPESFTLFTLNLDHLVKRRADPRFRAIYGRASIVSADGWPVVALANRGGARLSRTTGADLVVPLCAMAAEMGVPVVLLGTTRASLAGAAEALIRRVPGLDLRGLHAPPPDFDPHAPTADALGDLVAASGARLVFVALGAPKQELFAARTAARHPGLGLVCVGAGLDFLSGAQARAPRAMQAAGLEWFWRLAHDPRALAGRYARCAGLLVRLALFEPLVRTPRPQPGE